MINYTDTIITIILIITIAFLIRYQYNHFYGNWRYQDIQDTDNFHTVLNDNGVAIINDLFSSDEIEEILYIIENYSSYEYGNIQKPKYREDKIIPFSICENIIRKLYNKNPNFWDKTFPNYRIVECSCLISYPGAEDQEWHTDTNPTCVTDANIISIGVCLKDIGSDMGPLHVFPKTNRILCFKNNYKSTELINMLFEYFCKIFNSMIYLFYAISPCECTCFQGSLIFWSSKVLHRGSKNTSNSSRPMFYISLMEPNKNIPKGPTYSLHSCDHHKNRKLSSFK